MDDGAIEAAKRRAGERAAVDDLGNPVVVVDEARRVVTVNDAAASVFGVGPREAFARRSSTA